SYDYDNDGTFEVVNSTSASATVPASYLSQGPSTRTVRGRVADQDGAYTDATTDIIVRASAPKDLALSLGGATAVPRGSTVTLTGSFSVPGAPTAHTVVVTWGDGSDPETFSLAAGTTAFSRPHTYADDNPTATNSDVNTISVTVS